MGMNWLLTKSMETIPTNVEILNHFKLINPEQQYKIVEPRSVNPTDKWHGENTLGRIKRRGKIRIGFYEDAIPFTFYNKDSALVGFGIDLAHRLASDLEVEIEFVPIIRGHMIEGLKKDYYDIVMSDIFLSSKYAQEILLSKPYLSISLALITNKKNDDLNTFKSATQLDSFTIGYFEREEIAEEYASFFGNAKIYPMTNLDKFFNQTEVDSINADSLHIDAYLTSAERASVLTIFYQGFKVVNPLPYHINNPLVFPLAEDDVWKRYIDNWIEYRKNDGSISKVYDQWILGHEYKKKEPVWNVYDNIIVPMFAEKKNINK
jgi:ABC-type amino acid transport substrate-binding protein